MDLFWEGHSYACYNKAVVINKTVLCTDLNECSHYILLLFQQSSGHPDSQVRVYHMTPVGTLFGVKE